MNVKKHQTYGELMDQLDKQMKWLGWSLVALFVSLMVLISAMIYCGPTGCPL